MRVKTDARRDAIIETAVAVFQEMGYERASMAEISARLGGSKATLYNYFESKGELFAAAMTEAMKERGDELLQLLDPSNPDVRTVLERFGFAYLKLVTSPEALSITRAAVAEGANRDLGSELYRRGPRRGWEALAAYVRHLRDIGICRDVDPALAAAHFKGMLDAGIVEPLLFGASAEFTFEQGVPSAVHTFMRAYMKDAAAPA